MNLKALLFAATLAAGSALADTPRLLIWINGDKAYNGLQKVGNAFEKVSGVKVVVEHPVDPTDKFQQAAGAGKGPDIFCWPHDRVGEWAKAGLLTPLRPSARLKAEVEDQAWAAVSYRGHIWAYPIAIETIGLIYNKALVPTPPATWDDVIAIDNKLQAQGRHAILWDYNKSFFTWPMLAGAGGVIFGRDAQGDFDPRQVDVNNAGALAGAQTIDRLIKEGHMPRGARYSEMEAAFARGEVAMMISGPWAWDNARRAGIDIGVGAIPAVVAGKPSKSFVGVLGCMISAPSKNKDIAKEFLENHLMRPEALKVLDANVPIGVPANKAFYAELSVNPLIAASMTNARNGAPIPNIPEVGRFWTAMDAALEAITNGLQSPKDALDGAAARMLLNK
ncbi:maltose/maltodextrin ABC transporter substrate-binding protein MalE [Roseateles saccharophilus]|uniref:Maltodextrin-binding protein n=1 Tax=Roseateles saccharophilus TaxID=304 RepID=A0A4R3VA54_ROSSA|nr:maltose/maltodextrin ABC transporter substrate-binding protein MalE [Roseateles saccharophilus]MDG0835025.1 maltose/maltodextrin ABC transporter substrate-binding protein MalE [Roseateles saccharophilus]TCV00388.1 maltooligosaccharide-binding protein [Roseateles saccharophilus]